MELIRGLHNLVRQSRRSVVSIGKFDGVHKGHQQILSRVVDTARQRQCQSVVVVFEPDPAEFFMPEKAPARLTRFAEKWRLLADLGIDKLCCIRFNESLRDMSPQHFVDHILLAQLRTELLIVGDDFKFGKNRQGDFEFLMAQQTSEFSVQSTQSIVDHNRRISSTLVRNSLAKGEFDDVRQLLGRCYSISGRVAHGQKLGRTLGYRTINLPLKRRVSPLNGVFAVHVTGLASDPLRGVANVGLRPTVGGLKPQVEVHLFDFNQDIYGQKVTVSFLHKIRNEQKFENLDELTKQISIDADHARQWLSEHTTNT